MSEELKRGCVVFMKASSGLIGYGNAQCVSDVCAELGTISLYGHNQLYKTYDIDKIVEYPTLRAENERLKKIVAENRQPRKCEGCDELIYYQSYCRRCERQWRVYDMAGKKLIDRMTSKEQDQKDGSILMALIDPSEVQNFWDWLESEWMDCFAAQTLQESLTKLGYDSIEEAVEKFKNRYE